MALDPRFKISVASTEEMDEIMSLMEKAFRNDEIWKYTIKHCDAEEVHQWVMTNLTPRWLMPDITTYKATEVASGYAFLFHHNNVKLTCFSRRIPAWTALQYPWKWCNEGDERHMSAEDRALALSHGLPPACEGMDEVALGEFFHSLGATEEFGYDPETDYRNSLRNSPHFPVSALRPLNILKQPLRLILYRSQRHDGPSRLPEDGPGECSHEIH
jgi:hypothetical protein